MRQGKKKIAAIKGQGDSNKNLYKIITGFNVTSYNFGHPPIVFFKKSSPSFTQAVKVNSSVTNFGNLMELHFEKIAIKLLKTLKQQLNM